MKKLEELQYEELVSLVEYLRSISTSEEEMKNQDVLINIERFFPTLTAVQELEFNKIITDILLKEETAEKDFNDFKELNPNVEIDPDGKSIPTKKNYWEINIASLDNIYLMALNILKENNFKDPNKFKYNTQVYNAKNLTPFINRGKITSNYIFNRQLYLKKNENQLINQKALRRYESLLKEKVGSVDLLNSLLDYIKDKKYEEYSLFVNHLFERIELLCKDVNLEHPSNKEFYEKILEIK